MLVNSFDTKYSLTAKKYESLDNSFTKTVSASKKFSRILKNEWSGNFWPSNDNR